MKTKVFLTAIFTASLVALTGCGKQENVNVEDLANQLTGSSFEATTTRSKTVVDGLTIQVVEWTIVDAEKHQIAPFGYVFGNGVTEEWPSVVYNYEQGQLSEDGLGMHYTFTPLGSGEALNVLYWGNSLIINGDTIADSSAPIANLKKIVENLSNTSWSFAARELCIFSDTLHYIDTTINAVRRPDPITGKPTIVYDTIIAPKTKVVLDTIGATYEGTKFYAIQRDEKTLETTLTETIEETTYAVNEADRTLVLDKKVAETNEYHWGIASITSAKRFVLNVQNVKTGEMKQLRMSAFDKAKGKLTIGNDEYDLK